jgi:hypothetical protein
MDKSRIWLWAGFLAFVTAALLYFFWPGGKKLNWYENYRPDNQQPYDASLIYELVKDQSGKDRFVEVRDDLEGALKKWEGTPANYVFIGEGMWLDSLDASVFLDFVEKGGTLFLSVKIAPDEIFEAFLSEECLEDFEENYPYPADFDEAYEPDMEPVMLSLVKKGWEQTRLELRYYDRRGPAHYDWDWVSEELMYCQEHDTLGLLDGERVNYVRIPYGKGVLLLHTTPLAFSNFYMKNESGWDYANKALFYLNEGPVFWDRYSDYDSATRRFWGRRPTRSTRTVSSEGPLEYLLSQTTLAWAWYVGLGMALLYLFFRAKRKQRIIPILEPNTNTSLEFVATIGQLYFQQNSHRKLAVQKWKLFLGFIRDRYHLPTRELDEAFIQKLAERSAIEEAKLTSLFRLARNIERSEVFLSENTLIDLHKALDAFYRNCK